MIIKTWRDPYDAGFSPTKPRQIELQPGLTVLVGCNGAGKTTLLLNIEEEARKNKIPVHRFDNLHDGGTNPFGAILSDCGEEGDTLSMGIDLWTASEGEAIKLNLGRQSRLYKEFLRSGWYKNRNYKMSTIFSDDKKKDTESNIRILLYDAVDSGMSIDSVIEVKAFFDLIMQDAKEMGIELYLIISANEYELARGENCFDVNSGKYLTFEDYEAYRAFIIKSRKQKEVRIEKQKIWYEKRRQKEEAANKKKMEELTEKIAAKKELSAKRQLSWSEEYNLREWERELKELTRKTQNIS